MNSSKDNSVKYILTARSMWSDNVSQRSSFPDETYYSLDEAKDKCREFQRGLASHMIAGIEEVRVVPGAKPVKTGSYWELHLRQFEKTPDVKTLRDWPAEQSITQYLKVGDMVDNAMYEHFLNIMPPQYHYGGVLQVGGACDAVKNEDGVLKNTYLTFAQRSESDCWVFKGECFSREWINRNPDLAPKKEPLDEQIGSASKLAENAKDTNQERGADLEKER